AQIGQEQLAPFSIVVHSAPPQMRDDKQAVQSTRPSRAAASDRVTVAGESKLWSEGGCTWTAHVTHPAFFEADKILALPTMDAVAAQLRVDPGHVCYPIIC